MLNGKTALVTGSTSGIGLGIALSLARQGANVMLNGFGDIEGARAQFEGLEIEVDYHGADMAHAEEVVDLVRATEARFGGCDILVNNAGIQHVAPIQDFPPERWDAILAINLSSAFHSLRAALPGMLARNWGRVINIASVHGQVASVNKSAYVAAKHGLIGLTKTAALETATTGITVNAICPGWVLTPLVQKQVDARALADGVDNAEATRRLLGEKQPSLTFTTPEQLGALAVFLCSEAAANVRGQAWGMDGGWTAQ
ncbi:3-hydroxybutyrate dehydrogenase [Inhella proteolytica]|uniref:3-hydroxybutyrate dehydrogenase n=1 Tax=Inhella proteolytica TaxID=2795029 RepID=A0A931NH22_9BURK|nr:3-hydroxybutyrate dehydrogenase [Inhella proteolytica]MBH9577771.1 3-hydroxybutyrate dehydrogenase [Inhella proteolytica]